MADRRPGVANSIDPELGVCQKCGVTGFFELLVYCNVCGVSTEHSYCLNKMPKLDEVVIWSCEECVPTAPLKKLSLQSSGKSERRKVQRPQENPSSGNDALKKVSSNPSLENQNNAYGLPVIDPVWSVQNLLEKSQLELHVAKMDAEPVALRGEESATSTFKQLGKAFIELEASTGASEFKVLWKEIEEYFGSLERLLNKGLTDLEEKEKALVEKKSVMHAVVAEREAVVADKEQALVDRVQVQKDSAVAAIMEARDKSGKHVVALDFHAAAKEQALVDRMQEAKNTALATIMEAQDRSSKKAVAVHFQPRRELTRFCRQMDAEGLLKYIMEKRTNIVALREEIPVALKSATEPARLVLDSLKGFYPTDQTTDGNKKDLAALLCTRKSCIMLMESVAPLLVGADNPLNPETKQQAKAIADKWKARLNVNAANESSSLEAGAFLQLLATFRITSDFDEEELCELVLAVANRWQAPDLCRSLGLTHKMPVVVAKLISRSREIDAVHFVQAFRLTEKFPPVPLLKAYLKELRGNLQRTRRSARGDVSIQDDANRQELAALKAVIRCVEAHELQEDYPLGPLQQQVVQLENSKAKKKRMRAATAKHQQPKWARANGGRHHEPRVPVDLQLQHPPAYGEWSLHGCCRKDVSSSDQHSYY